MLHYKDKSNMEDSRRQSILKSINLNSKSISECVQILKEWINKQNHFNKKDFGVNFLEATIISCKGSVERAKARLDKYCTLRTSMPRFFDKINAKHDFQDMHQGIKVILLPQTTEDFYKVIIVKANDFNVSTCFDFYRFGALVLEYLKAYDHFYGTIVLIDYMDISIKTVIAGLNPVDLGEAIKLYTDGYGMRIKGIHFLTSSKTIEIVVSLLRSLVSQKIGDRVNVHSSLKTLHEVIPKHILPKEYGGTEKPLDSLHESFLDLLTTPKNLEYLVEMKEARTIESLRPIEDFNSTYMGTPGTFKSLAID